jgi:hypothetical protein
MQVDSRHAYRMLGVLFLCNKSQARAAKRRVQLFLLMRDPLQSLPTFWNSAHLTQAQVGLTPLLPPMNSVQQTRMMRHNTAVQPVGPARMVGCMRTRSGRRVLVFIHYNTNGPL